MTRLDDAEPAGTANGDVWHRGTRSTIYRSLGLRDGDSMIRPRLSSAEEAFEYDARIAGVEALIEIFRAQVLGGNRLSEAQLRNLLDRQSLYNWIEMINITMSGDEALVLFDLLMRFNRDEVPCQIHCDEAEKRVLWNLEALLEKTLPEPLAEDYELLVRRAKKRLWDQE
jgi:hypothetical protein